MFKIGDSVKIIKVLYRDHSLDKNKIYKVDRTIKCTPSQSKHCRLICKSEYTSIRICCGGFYNTIATCGYKLELYTGENSKNFICYRCKDKLFCTIK